jgi:hypothetical protein
VHATGAGRVVGPLQRKRARGVYRGEARAGRLRVGRSVGVQGRPSDSRRTGRDGGLLLSLGHGVTRGGIQMSRRLPGSWSRTPDGRGVLGVLAVLGLSGAGCGESVEPDPRSGDAGVTAEGGDTRRGRDGCPFARRRLGRAASVRSLHTIFGRRHTTRRAHPSGPRGHSDRDRDVGALGEAVDAREHGRSVQHASRAPYRHVRYRSRRGQRDVREGLRRLLLAKRDRGRAMVAPPVS